MCPTDSELFFARLCGFIFDFVDYRKNMCLGVASNNQRIQATKSVSGEGQLSDQQTFGLRSAQKLDKGTINLPLGR